MAGASPFHASHVKAYTQHLELKKGFEPPPPMLVGRIGVQDKSILYIVAESFMIVHHFMERVLINRDSFGAYRSDIVQFSDIQLD